MLRNAGYKLKKFRKGVKDCSLFIHLTEMETVMSLNYSTEHWHFGNLYVFIGQVKFSVFFIEFI